jgi:hypothetical protein
MSELIPESSPLRRHPENLNPRHRLILDGIRYSVEITELAYHRLVKTLLAISQLSKEPLPPNSFAGVLADVWTIIDSVNRLRALIIKIPKSSEVDYVKSFLSRTEVVREMRNVVQHIHGRLEKLVKFKQPTWGTIGWVTLNESPTTSGKIHLLVPASFLEGEHRLINPSGETFRARLDLITLNAHGLSIRILDLVEEVATFISIFQEELAKQFKDIPHSGAELYFCAEFEFMHNNGRDTDNKNSN